MKTIKNVDKSDKLVPPLSHKLVLQVYFYFLISKILSCFTSQHDSNSASWLHMVFSTQHDVCFSNYVSNYFKSDILHLQREHDVIHGTNDLKEDQTENTRQFTKFFNAWKPSQVNDVGLSQLVHESVEKKLAWSGIRKRCDRNLMKKGSNRSCSS